MDSCLTIDRISNLPGSLIDDILKYLPLRDAVRTSILSREWQYKWQTIPHLVFDRKFEKKLLENHTIESVIDQVLLLHKGSMVKFKYNANSCLSVTALYQWFHFLSKSNHSIEDLSLRFPDSLDTPQVMPHHLYNFDQLKHLQLHCCILELPSPFKGFGRLVTLDLKNVIILGGTDKLISKCPMLEHLNISRRNHLTFAVLEIEAPNLKTFVFLGKCQSIWFKNVSFLEIVSITPSHGSEINLFEFMGQLSSIKELELHHFSWLLRTGKLATKLIHLSVLRCTVNFVSLHEVTCALLVMRGSPNLQHLEITSTTNEDDDTETCTRFLKEFQQRKIKLRLRHLKSVEIVSFSASKPEMEFVMLVFSAATTKVELNFRLHLRGATEKGYFMFKRLARFPRASSKAKIIA